MEQDAAVERFWRIVRRSFRIQADLRRKGLPGRDSTDRDSDSRLKTHN